MCCRLKNALNYNPVPVVRKLAIVLAAAFVAACALLPADYNGERAPRETAIVPLKAERPIIALALGSGGARGFAHVGVIKTLEEAGIEADS